MGFHETFLMLRQPIASQPVPSPERLKAQRNFDLIGLIIDIAQRAGLPRLNPFAQRPK
jgi:hypothetical protein